MMKNSILLLSKVLVGLMLLAPAAPAAVQFTALGGDVTQGSQISVPVTVTGFSGIGLVELDLTFDSSLLQYQAPPGSYGLPFLGNGNFGNPSPGIIKLSWDNEDPFTYPNGISVADGTTLFTVQFLANQGLGSSSIGFNIIELRDQQLNPVASSLVLGTVNVVPEPINIALGIFAGLFAGGTTLRWVLRKRSVRSAASS